AGVLLAAVGTADLRERNCHPAAGGGIGCLLPVAPAWQPHRSMGVATEHEDRRPRNPRATDARRRGEIRERCAQAGILGWLCAGPVAHRILAGPDQPATRPVLLRAQTQW